LAAFLEIPAPLLTATSDFNELLRWLQLVVGADENAFDEHCGINAPINEHLLYLLGRNDRDAPTLQVAGMVTMLALLYLRFGRPAHWTRPEWEISRMGADGRLSVDGFVHSLRQRLRSGPTTILEIANWLYADYVILQHQLVAASKLPDNTFRFQREGNRLRFFNVEAHADFLDSRYDAMATTIHELGFCGDPRETNHTLTTAGQRLLDTGDLP
jgi:hypothetical protein